MPVLIDGHNLLWSIHHTDKDAPSISDIRLCHIVNRYLKRSGEKGEIVFDGTGPRDKTEFDNTDKLQVSFSGLGVEADSIIEAKITASTAPKRLIVVSSDRRVRNAARKRQATAIKSEVFWSQLQKRLRRKHSPKEPAEKRFGLTESETQQWLKFFDMQ